MVKTYGLTHINLLVRDPERSLRFYSDLFGVKEYYRDENNIQVQGPGDYDVIAFEKGAPAGDAGCGITHFGFRLTVPEDIETVVEIAERAGGTVLRRGEFAPGCPFAYIRDPDGNLIELSNYED